VNCCIDDSNISYFILHRVLKWTCSQTELFDFVGAMIYCLRNAEFFIAQPLNQFVSYLILRHAYRRSSITTIDWFIEILEHVLISSLAVVHNFHLPSLINFNSSVWLSSYSFCKLAAKNAKWNLNARGPIHHMIQLGTFRIKKLIEIASYIRKI
jgi:hypothetical protein